MKKLLLSALALTAFSGAAEAALIGPSTYQSFADSPFNPASFTNFYFEDFEDVTLDQPGITYSSNCITRTASCFPGGPTDSVGNGGNPNAGHSLWASGTIIIDFDESILGSLPTAAGLAWTDGANPITFTAFDENGLLLGTIVGTHADFSFNGELAEDRFYGATNAGGISRLVIVNPGGIEIDHVQYGLNRVLAVPEPSTWALMLVGFGAVGWSMRRRSLGRRAQAV